MVAMINGRIHPQGEMNQSFNTPTIQHPYQMLAPDKNPLPPISQVSKVIPRHSLHPFSCPSSGKFKHGSQHGIGKVRMIKHIKICPSPVRPISGHHRRMIRIPCLNNFRIFPVKDLQERGQIQHPAVAGGPVDHRTANFPYLPPSPLDLFGPRTRNNHQMLMRRVIENVVTFRLQVRFHPTP